MCMLFFFFFKQKTAYEMRISDWSSDVCSSDLSKLVLRKPGSLTSGLIEAVRLVGPSTPITKRGLPGVFSPAASQHSRAMRAPSALSSRSEEHTSELQSLMRSSYAVFCLKKKNKTKKKSQNYHSQL